MPNSLDFNKENFLHVISVCFIVLWFNDCSDVSSFQKWNDIRVFIPKAVTQYYSALAYTKWNFVKPGFL